MATESETGTTEARIARILEARDEHERVLIEALETMLDTALATDDAAWAAGIERAGTDRPCDKAAHAIAWVVGSGFEDIVADSRLRRLGKLQRRTREEARRVRDELEAHSD